MKSLEIVIGKIHCVRTTMEIGKDEVYGLLLVSPVTTKGPLKPRGAVVPLRSKVFAGDMWDYKDLPFRFPLEEGVIGTNVSLVLYEKDNASIYNKLMNEANRKEVPASFPWDKLLSELDLSDIVNPIAWASISMKIAIEVIKYFRQDDQIDDQSFTVAVPERKTDPFPRELTFAGRGGKFRIGLSATLVD